ncbi:type IV secretion system protein VirB6 [Granulicella aggregans]|uniref:Type IV secretion system protein VirB6 n=1 Tax=Granulicella aggregans TaxID=474949 RepID=A0A7W7ZKJ5_9BACT|nr:hypothetical protein [Granulicella aggregans]MBB5061582.1 type IV secretion system protein VirB6 [Granulicella aggregans]
MNTPPPVVDWLGQFTQSLTDLTLQNGGALSDFGMLLLTFIATMILIGIAVRMSSWSAHFGGNRSVSLDELRTFLFRLLFCCVIEHYWVTNLPGANFGFNRMFSYIAAAISQVLDHAQLNQMTALIAEAGQKTDMPATLAPMEYICYYYVQALLGIASGIIFLINCSGLIFYAVAALFGPLMIPLYMTETFHGKFLHFVEVLLSLAMIRAVAAAFIYVWSQFLTGFMHQTFQENYTIANWLANLIPFTTIYIAFILNMFLIPSVTQMMFGGGAGIAGKIGETVEKIGAFVAAAG